MSEARPRATTSPRTRRRRPEPNSTLESWLRRFDTQRLVTIYLVILVAIPSNLVIGPLGGAGSPLTLAGVGLLGLWTLNRAQRHRPPKQRQILRWALFAVFTSFGVSYAIAMSGPLNSTESSSANLGMISLLSWSGILLVCNDLVPGTRSFMTILRRISAAGGWLGLLAAVQFFTGELLVDRIWIPGLQANAAQFVGGLTERGGLNRPFGTAVNPIEFGSMLTMILPIAINVAMVDRTRGLFRRWLPVALLAFACFFSISRSALLSGGLALCILGVAWPPRVRRIAAVMVFVVLAVVALTLPGMLGTLSRLFTGIGSDSSAASRTSSYPIAEAFVERSPFFGRGFGTFLPELHILDNAYLGLLIEVGVIGFVLFLTLLATGFAAGQSARRIAPGRPLGQIGNALSAAIAAGAVGLALYDGLGFPKGSAMIFMFLGLAGASRRLAAEERLRSPDVARTATQGPRARPVTSR